uniref:Uncharacterized protein n=1 Tax=Anguilla anguilla TaxID=7936 RepID=A0A0E9TEV2_ANGAN
MVTPNACLLSTRRYLVLNRLPELFAFLLGLFASFFKLMVL